MIAWLINLLRRDIKPPRELIFVSYIEADRKIRSQTGWRVAPEEDRNREWGMVYLERDTR
jgi:hypothetical protein